MPLREDFRLPVRHGYAVCAAHGVWRSLVARFVRDEEVVGSNPATPTIQWPPSQMVATSRWNRATRPGGFDSTPFECGYFVVTLRPRSSRAGPASSRRRWRSRPDVLVQAGRRPGDPGLGREADARGPDEPGPGRDARGARPGSRAAPGHAGGAAVGDDSDRGGLGADRGGLGALAALETAGRRRSRPDAARGRRRSRRRGCPDRGGGSRCPAMIPPRSPGLR